MVWIALTILLIFMLLSVYGLWSAYQLITLKSYAAIASYGEINENKKPSLAKAQGVLFLVTALMQLATIFLILIFKVNLALWAPLFVLNMLALRVGTGFIKRRYVTASS